MENGTINGWPTRAWIHRRYYPYDEEAIAEAKLAVRDLKQLFVIKDKVPRGFEKYWPDKFHWHISERPPFTGACGAFYHERPDYYIVDAEVRFIPGEDSATIKRKRKEVRERWQRGSGKQLSLW
jgi:hypothetical protein